MKTPIPQDIKKKMDLWRASGSWNVPEEYIAWHFKLATAATEELKKDYIIYQQSMVDDGWCDGMKFLQLIVENKKTQELLKIKWSDSQIWFRHHQSGGWSPLK